MINDDDAVKPLPGDHLWGVKWSIVQVTDDNRTDDN